MSRDVEPGTEVYVPIEYGEGRLYGKITDEVTDVQTGERKVVVLWADGDRTVEYPVSLMVEDKP